MMNWMTGCMFMQFDWEMGALCTLLVLEPCKTTASKVNTDSAALEVAITKISIKRSIARRFFSSRFFVPDTSTVHHRTHHLHTRTIEHHGQPANKKVPRS